MVFNLKHEALSHYKVRKAVTMAIDNIGLADNMPESVLTGSHSIVRKGYNDYYDGSFDFKYNVSEARQLMQEAVFTVPVWDEPSSSSFANIKWIKENYFAGDEVLEIDNDYQDLSGSDRHESNNEISQVNQQSEVMQVTFILMVIAIPIIKKYK